MIKVVHSSKYIDYIFNFSATENNLSWSLTAEGDGDLFINPLTNGLATNVASFTVDSIAPSFPISLTNGASKSVSIVKTTNGQTASLTLRQRRAVNKTVNYNVPDLGAYDGRYLYVILNNNTLNKIDSQLLLPSNYAGAGVWTVNPIIASFTLPTLPNSAFYSKVKFVKNGNTQKLLLIGVLNTTMSGLYCSYFNISNDTIYDLTQTTLNGYTSFTFPLDHGATATNCQYDYINEFCYIKIATGTNGQSVVKLNLSNNSFTNLGYTSFADNHVSAYEHQFSPIDLQFIAVGDYSIENSRNYNYKFVGNNGGTWGYNYRNNYRVCTGDTFGKVRYFNNAGTSVEGVSYGTIGVYGCTELYGFDRANTVFMTYIDSYAIVNRNTSSSKFRITDKNLASPNNYLLNLRNCHYSNIYVAFCGTSARVLSTRMVVFKESETNADFGYLDFGATVYSADANQLLL